MTQEQDISRYSVEIKRFLETYQGRMIRVGYSPIRSGWCIPTIKRRDSNNNTSNCEYMSIPNANVFLDTLRWLSQLNSSVKRLEVSLDSCYPESILHGCISWVASNPNISFLRILRCYREMIPNNNGLLGGVLTRDSTFETLELCEITDKDLVRLMDGLQHNNRITKVFLRSMRLHNADHLSRLSQLVAQHPSLELLLLEGLTFTTGQSVPFCFSDLFKGGNRLTDIRLDITRMQFEPDDYMKEWAQVVSKNQTLKELTLFQCSPSVISGWEIFFTDGLRRNQFIQTLRLSQVKLNPAQIARLCACLSDNQTLRAVIFEGTVMEDEHMCMLIETLVDQRSIQELSVVGTSRSPLHFGQKSQQALGHLFQQNQIIKKCQIVIHWGGDTALLDISFILALRTNDVLKSLEIESLAIDAHPKGIEELGHALKQNKTLRHLVLLGCFMWARSAQSLAEALGYNRDIEEFFIYPSPCDVCDDPDLFDALFDQHLCEIMRAGGNYTLREVYNPAKVIDDEVAYPESVPYFQRNQECKKKKALLMSYFWLALRKKGAFI